MTYSWDPNKAAANQKKHRIRFSDAVAVFEDDLAVTMPDDEPGEDRYVTVGADFLGRVLTVVFTWRGSEIRIISARKATARERMQYEGT